MQVLIGGKEVLHESLYIRKPSWNLREEEKRKKNVQKTRYYRYNGKSKINERNTVLVYLVLLHTITNWVIYKELFLAFGWLKEERLTIPGIHLVDRKSWLPLRQVGRSPEHLHYDLCTCMPTLQHKQIIIIWKK